jgi:hypothetical protein
MLFDYLVVGQILTINPAHAVRGPKHVKRGETPLLSPAQTRQLLDSMDLSTVVGLRDRALIGLVTYIFSPALADVAGRPVFAERRNEINILRSRAPAYVTYRNLSRENARDFM